MMVRTNHSACANRGSTQTEELVGPRQRDASNASGVTAFLHIVHRPVLSENAITPSSRDSAMDRLSRLPSTRCEGSGHVGSCGLSSISLSSSCFGCSYCPFAPNGPTGSNCSLSATKSQYFDARWDDPPTGPLDRSERKDS